MLGGNVRKDAFGRIVFDLCPSDHDHLLLPPPPEGQERNNCRVLLDNLFGALVGKSVMLNLHLEWHDLNEKE